MPSKRKPRAGKSSPQKSTVVFPPEFDAGDASDSSENYQSRFNEQSRDERTNPPTPKTKTAGSGAGEKGDEDLLRSIREDYKFALDYWSYNRDEAATDMQYVQAEYWSNEEKQKRAGRPCLAPDEISQYLKQATNNFRQNKRAIKVLPRGEGASDEDAERRSSIIRAIQYSSNAQAAFTTAFEAAVECGFGFWGITLKRVPNGKGMAIEPRIRRIPNQFTVLLDPEAKESDYSDQNISFVGDIFRRSTFARKFPNATKTSFTTEDEKLAPDWFKGEGIVVAEAWRRTSKSRVKLKIKTKQGPTTVYRDELADGDQPEILSEDEATEHTVTQYITNGVEILDRIPWAGSWIPVIPMLGEEFYVPEAAGQSKRVFFSLTRRMRVPQKMLGFIASQEAEEFGMAPRSPLLIWEGQEVADKKALETLNTNPKAYIRLRPGETKAGQPIPDLPAGGRLPFQPNAQAYEIAREAWRRSIQAAAGITPLPTAAQRQNEKSGVALDKIQTQEAIGSYHFTDNADRSLENGGRQLNELITKVMDTPRQVAIRNADDSHAVLHVGAEEHMGKFTAREQQQAIQQGDAPAPSDAGPDYLITDRGEWDVTISTGPNFESQREEQDDFVDTLLKEASALQLPPPVIAKMLSLAIKMKNLGHFGDEIAKLLDPDDQTQQQLQAAQQQLAQMQEETAKLVQELQQLKLEKAGKVIDNQFKGQFHQMQLDVDQKIAQLNADLKAYIANVQTKAQSAAERDKLFQETQIENHHAAHEIGMQKDQQAHEKDLAASAAATQQAAQVSDQVHQQTMAEQQPEASTS